MSKTRPFLVFLSLLAVSGLALAQDPPDQGTPPTEPTQRPQPQQETQQQLPEMQRPIYLSGKVIYDDGSPADMSVQVEMLCNGRVRRKTHTFSGGFTLEVNNTNRVMVMDASTSSRDLFGGINSEPEQAMAGMMAAGGENPASMRSSSGFTNLMGCELRANQPGFQSDIVPLSVVRPLDNPDVGVIVLHRAGTITGTTTSVVSMAAPKKAKKAYRRAVKEVRKKKGSSTEKAISELEKATEIYPEYADAWELLGQIRLQQQDEPGARQAFELAAACDPKYLRPNLVMMELEVRRENWEEVSKWSSRITELNPYIVMAQYYHGVANMTLNRIEPAQQSFQKVRDHYKSDDYPYAGYLLGYILATQGEFESAASEFRHFLKIKEQAPEADQIKDSLAQWEKEGHIKSVKN